MAQGAEREDNEREKTRLIKITNVARKTTLFRSATQFAHTCGSLGELPHFLIIVGIDIMRQEGNALKVVEFIFRPKKKKLTREKTMKLLQWFPGHMTKAVRMMEENAAVCDGIIYVLDARCPAASYNPNLKKIFGAKPVLYVLNKADLADERVDAFVKYLRDNGRECIKMNAADSRSKRAITAAIDNLTKEKREKNAAKGFTKTFRFMVCGVPNTGKSTVINLLAGSARTQTGNKAGVTRGKQWIRLPACELLDTPGTTPPSFTDQRLAVHLAYVGSLNDDILDMDDIALALLEELWAKYPEKLTERYGVKGGTPLEMLNAVCARRGFVLRGNDFDYERGERALIDDFRKGRIGKITLDDIADASVFGC